MASSNITKTKLPAGAKALLALGVLLLVGIAGYAHESLTAAQTIDEMQRCGTFGQLRGTAGCPR